MPGFWTSRRVAFLNMKNKFSKLEDLGSLLLVKSLLAPMSLVSVVSFSKLDMCLTGSPAKPATI